LPTLVPFSGKESTALSGIKFSNSRGGHQLDCQYFSLSAPVSSEIVVFYTDGIGNPLTIGPEEKVTHHPVQTQKGFLTFLLNFNKQ
jgi:hypothetical protein